MDKQLNNINNINVTLFEAMVLQHRKEIKQYKKKIVQLENDIKYMNNFIQEQLVRDAKYQNYNNITHGQNSIANHKGNAITSSKQPMQIEKVENLNFGTKE
jgi:hypothetical protein